MSAFHDNALMGASGSQGYQISRSVRLRSSASAYFNRTLASSGSLRAWTWSAWVKRGSLNTQQNLFGWIDLTSGNFQQAISFESNNTLEFQMYNSILGGYVNRKNTAQVFRDISAWYHIVVVWDSNNATAEDRARIYVNGVRVTAWANNTNPSLNLDSYINNSTYPLGIGRAIPSSTAYFDGYLTEVNFIDGQALTPSSFGETDTITGVWKPKKYAGTYGTNGFYLNFSDNSNNTSTTIGKDYSGNGNNWTPNNISVTSGVTYDSMLDVPTLYADGGNGRGNYPVINPLDYLVTNGSISNGNLTYTTNTSGSNNYQRMSMKFPSSGKWYAEFTATQVNIGSGLGYATIGVEGSNSFLWWVYSSPYYQIQGTSGSYTTIPTISSGDIIMVAVDMDSGKAWYGQNGTWLLSGNPSNGTAMSNPATFTAGSSSIGVYFDGRTGSATNIINANFGQRPFTYTPPSGFKALNTQNLPDSTIKAGNKYMDVAIQTGNTTGRTVSGLAFQPDLVWVKNRAGSTNRRWGVIDSVRGVNKTLTTQYTDAEVTSQTDLLTAFNSDGFTIGADANLYGWNGFVESYVHFVWKAGNGSSSNTAGSITSTVSVNATAGFSVVTYSGNGAAGATVGHGLGVAPNMIIVKCRTAGTNSWTSWQVYHSSLTNPATSFLRLNETSATYTGYAAAWNSTNPTSSVFSVSYSAGAGVNGSGDTFVAYCWAAVAGYSAFGSYTGNGSSDGPFVFCGFRPRFVMIKRTDSTGPWVLWDSAREPTNDGTTSILYPNYSDAEYAQAGGFDLLSNGFKLRASSNIVDYNASGGTYIFMAMAESPFKLSLAR